MSLMMDSCEIYQESEAYLATFDLETSKVYIATLKFRFIDVISYYDKSCGQNFVLISFIHPYHCILFLRPPRGGPLEKTV